MGRSWITAKFTTQIVIHIQEEESQKCAFPIHIEYIYIYICSFFNHPFQLQM